MYSKVDIFFVMPVPRFMLSVNAFRKVINMKKNGSAIIFGFILTAIFSLGILIGRYAVPYHQENTIQSNNAPSSQKSESDVVSDAQLLELHVFKEELLLDVPIPALRFQVKFRTPHKVTDKLNVELHFKSDLQKELGDGRDASACELVEEHFGWTVYTYGYTIGGDTFPSALLDAVVQNPYDYVSVRITE